MVSTTLLDQTVGGERPLQDGHFQSTIDGNWAEYCLILLREAAVASSQLL
jgi:hypothetical protein